MKKGKKDENDKHAVPKSDENLTRPGQSHWNSSRIKNLKVELQDLEAWYCALFNNANDAIFLMDYDRFIDCNPKTLEIFGCTKEQIIRQTPYNRFSPRFQPDGRISKDKALEKIRLALEEGPQLFEWRHLRYDGTMFEAEVSLNRVKISENFYIQAFVRDITEQKHSHLQYETILKTTMDGFCLLDSQGRILEVNDAYCDMVGYNRQELLSMNLADVEAVESADDMQRHIKKLMDSGSHQFETRHQCKDGRFIDLEVSANALKMDGDRLFAFFRDITESKQAQKKLIASEERYRSTIDNMLEGCQIIDRNWKYLYVNDAVIKHSRRTRGELLGHTMMEMYPGIEKTEFFAVLQECMEKRITHRKENEFKFPNGDKGWFELCIQPVPEGIFILSLDITERKKAEEEILRARQDWENIFQAIGQPSFILDSQHRIITANRAAVKKLGMSLERLKDKKCFELLHLKKFCPNGCPMEKMIHSGCPETVEMEIEVFGGVYLVSCTPVCDNQGRLEKVIHIATDITARKEAEQKLREHEEQLKSLASELSLAEERERRRIAAGIHDDIAQRLALAKLELQTMQKTISDSNIISSLQNQCGTIDRIMEDARSLTFELSNHLLYEIGVEAAIESFINEQISKKSSIRCRFTSLGPQIDIDEDIRIVLYQGVRELLTNTIKHAEANRVDVRIVKSNEQISIIIEDDGIGFDTFKPDSHEYDRGGFGLLNIRERLEYLGGNLDIQSEPYKGTCVTMTVPLELKASIQ